MGNLGDALQRHAKRLGIERQVEAVGVVEKATEEISRYIPKEDFEIVSFNRGVLKIKVSSPVVAAEILNQKKNFNRDLIKKIVFNN